MNKRSRESAEKQRLNIKKKLSGNIDISNRVQKFVDCRSKDVEKREIYIVEGDSALGSVKLSRDAEYQGIMPVRGKILNCLKADYARIFKSEIITDLIRVLGCGVEIQNKHVKDLAAFDLNNLRWSKVVICTDGDVDGFQIRTLILTMLYRLTPTLIQQGYVYIAETPLFEINCGDKTWFAYSDKEKADIVKSLEGKKYKIDRSKGLGENDPDMMWLTTMNPETRRLIRVMPEDVERTAEVFDLLLGDNLQGRKDHIAEKTERGFFGLGGYFINVPPFSSCSLQTGQFPCRGKGKGALWRKGRPRFSEGESQRGYSLLKRECPPGPLKRNAGGFRFPPHPLKRHQRGGAAALPLFETRSRGKTGASGSGKRSRGRPICSPGVRCAYRCGDAMPDGTGLAQPVGDFRNFGRKSVTASPSFSGDLTASRSNHPSASFSFDHEWPFSFPQEEKKMGIQFCMVSPCSPVRQRHAPL